MLRMNESKSKTNVKSCEECVIIRYIFCVMYEKIVLVVMDNKSLSVNGSRCLISYVNVVILLIKILNTIQNELPVTFVSLSVFMYCAILALNLPCRFVDSYGPSMLSLSKSKLSPWEWSRVRWNGVECLGI
jgi:hypothetical protein